MLILLAESKTMSDSQKEVAPALFQQHTPQFETTADSIMSFLASLPTAEISQRLSVSLSLAAKASNYAYDFPHKLTGYKALFGYTGEAFRALDASTLSPEAVENAFSQLKFISSVYGLLNSDDIIKPYRCEFNKPITSQNKTAVDLFKQKNTIVLVNWIKEKEIKDIINLLPGDADKCIDWKIVRAFASVNKVVFQHLLPDGKLKTPIASRLKELRGKMARDILMNNISSFSELTSFESQDYIYSPEHSKPLLPVFLSD